jgi:MFS family permease
MKNTQRLNLNIKNLRLLQIIASANFAMPIIVLYYLNHGLSLFQIASFATVMSIIVLLLEIPSGSFADKKGRKISLLISSLFSVAAYFFLFFGDSYIPFLLVAAFSGAANAFWSGANTALLYDSLVELKRENEFKKIKGKQFAYGMWSFAIASLIGGFLGGIHLIIPIAITGIMKAFQLLFSLKLKDPELHKKILKGGGHILESIKFALKHEEVRNLILYSIIIIGFLDGTFTLIQPYFKLVGINPNFFGTIYMVSLIGTGILGKYAGSIEEKIGNKPSLILIASIFIGGFILLSFPIGKFIVVPFLLLEFMYGFVFPLIEDYINKHISSEKRATILSIQNFSQKILIALLIPVVGLFMDISIPYGFLFIAIFGLLTLIYPTSKLIKTS